MAERCYAECCLCRLSLMLSVAYKPYMLNVILLDVIMLIVVAPQCHPSKLSLSFELKKEILINETSKLIIDGVNFNANIQSLTLLQRLEC